MPIASETLSIVLAGGAGSRLSPLTADRAKPAVPFGGQYRIIDFTLSNCLHSNLRRILVLTQYKSHSLHQHLRDTWSIFNPALGEYITAVPPQLRTGESWYQGTADAIYQNLFVVRRSDAKHVLVLAGDHIYRMDYAQMLRAHQQSGADATVGCMEVDLSQAQAFGVVALDDEDRIRRFQEKPRHPLPSPQRPHKALVSMGIYVFSTNVLCQELEHDSSMDDSSHDFGNDLLPRLIHTHRVHGFRFGESGTDCSLPGYWRDVGTIDAYYQANMDLIKEDPPLDLHAAEWPIYKSSSSAPPARVRSDKSGQPGVISDSLLSDGVVISGGWVNDTVLSPNVRINSGATVDNCILFDDVTVGEGAQLKDCIVDKGVQIPAGETIGYHAGTDARRFRISAGGVVVVPKGYQFAVRSGKFAVPHEIIRPRRGRALVDLT